MPILSSPRRRAILLALVLACAARPDFATPIVAAPAVAQARIDLKDLKGRSVSLPRLPQRILIDDGRWVAYVPFAAGAPYEVRIAPRDPVGRLDQLDDVGRNGLAAVLSDVLGRYERLWGDDVPGDVFPYLMWIHQAPKHDTGGYHLHVHLSPPERAPGVLRYLAAGETGSGTLSNPVMPEDAAARLRSC